MGAWGSGVFENDGALDWVNALQEAEGLGFVQGTLTELVELDDYLDLDYCEAALAAAALVAALTGSRVSDLPDEAAAWVNRHRGAAAEPLIPLALRAIDRIRSDSEMRDLWAEDADSLAEWLPVIDDLAAGLRQADA